MAGNKIPLECEQCNQPFLRQAAEMRRHKRQFCSRKCAVASRGTLDQRFWAKVDKTVGLGPQGECWEWRGAKTDSGYGQMFRGGDTPRQKVRASHVSFYLANKRWPRLLICHSCDNPPCVRPDHLWEGSHELNQRDKVAKGRQSRGPTSGPTKHPERMAHGEAQPNAKLTNEAILEIRRVYPHRRHGDVAALARKFGVSRTAVVVAGKGLTWKHVN